MEFSEEEASRRFITGLESVVSSAGCGVVPQTSKGFSRILPSGNGVGHTTKLLYGEPGQYWDG